MAELAPWRAAVAGPPRAFELDGEHFVIVSDWSVLLDRLRFETWQLDLLHDLLDEAGADRIDDRLDDELDTLTLRECARVAEGLVEAATGRRWWVAQRLIASAADDWHELDGMLLLRGVDLVELARAAPARLCNVMHRLIVEGLGKTDREMFEFRLRRPPRGVDVRRTQVMTDAEQGAAFMAAMGALQGGRS
ncbi:hypothetical protein JOL79_06945 [Microbispora sp. RL4-1S]|uniref:Uncharacterized protein n=1 Tax=Microbispora oryzae TaxID=2806554 RepID=A0A940WDJ2_9ACTN|nr:hypothetical protein [Microbispora oryzae]MBP2703535.1 hypothetical protein [Microbispora oryzae]